MAGDHPKLPPRIQVGPHTYDVEFDEQRCRDLELRGRSDQNTLTFLLHPGLPESMVRETVLHELLHAVLSIQGVDVTDEPLLTSENEERLVRCLAPLLLDTLRRNPRLATWLLAAD